MTWQPAAPAHIGAAISRPDGRAKVTGQARYVAEHGGPDIGHGVVVSSTITRGRIVAIDTTAAEAVAGVWGVLTHRCRPKMRSSRVFHKDMASPGGMPLRPLYDEQVHFHGQPVALVVAADVETARWAAALVKVDYQVEPHETRVLERLGEAHEPRGFKAGFSPPPAARGDADAAFAAAAVRVDVQTRAGAEHHNPLEMHATVVLRDAHGHLVVYDKTQGSENSALVIRHALGLDSSQVTVRNAFIGGAFGSGLRPQYQMLMAVMAAQWLERSVKVALTRAQMFSFGHRPECWQRVRLGADSDGRLRALIHEAVAETSRAEDYVEVTVNWSGQLYAAESARFGYQLVDTDLATPMDMRAPGAAHGVHAIEVAMDALAHELQMDPLALRLLNYAETDANTRRPFSSKALRACYEQGAAHFGWQHRPMAPRQRREGHELIGWGMATGTWEALQAWARVHAVLHADGSLVLSTASTDIGAGTYTALTLIAAASLGLPVERVSVVLGDSSLPTAPLQGGSWTLASVGSAVEAVCEKLKKALLARARQLAPAGSVWARVRLADARFEAGELRFTAPGGERCAMALTTLLAAADNPRIEARHLLLPSLLKQRRFTRATHSAVFVEVRVDEALGTVRVTRVVSAVAAGRIVSAKTARSQISGAVVWGIGQALHEHSLCDHALGRFVNTDLADYHVPVNADVNRVDVLFVEEEDFVVSRLGAKGVGEIGIVGVAAAISNAIFHATGRRLVDLPMTPDRVMPAG